MRRFAVLLACLLAATALRAQDGGFTIAGRMVNSISGEPLARAEISVLPIPPEEEGALPARNDAGTGRRFDAGSPPLVAVTGSDGSFRFAGLPEGRYHLLASRRGYQRANYQEHANFYAAVVCGPQHPEAARLRFALMPFGSIRGTVLDSSGDPVESATVQLYMQSTDGSGAVRLRQTGSLRRGSSRFSFGDLAPGTYFLAVTGTPWFNISGEGAGEAANPFDVAYPATFFDGASTADAAQPIALRGGEAVQANFSLHAVPAVHIKVAAGQDRTFFPLPQLGTPAFDQSVPVSSGWAGRAVQPGDGGMEFTASVAPGPYTMEGDSGERTLEIGSDTTLERPAETSAAVTLSGKVAMADGSALPAGLHVQLLPDAAGPGGGFLVPRGRSSRQARTLNRRPLDLAVAADGRFVADVVPPGRYRLASRAEGPALAVTGIAAGGAEAAADLSLQIGSEPAIVAATLAPADRAVSGQVTTGAQPASGVMVLLIPEAPLSPALTYQQESDSDGTWTLYGVVAGRYKAVAIRNGWDLAWKQPATLAPYLKGAVDVVVAAPGVTTLSSPVLAQER